MRTFLVIVILALLFLLVRSEVDPLIQTRAVNPLLFGYGALFAGGIVAAELLRPLLSLMSGPVRFVTVAVVAGLVWWGSDYVVKPRPTRVTDVSGTQNQGPKQFAIPLSWDGHFRSVAQINGVDAGILVDTGASLVLLRYEEAARIGIDVESLDYSRPIATAGGRVHGALVMLEKVKLGRLELTDVEGAVVKKGDLQSNLVGLSYLGRLNMVTLQNDLMVLQE